MRIGVIALFAWLALASSAGAAGGLLDLETPPEGGPASLIPWIEVRGSGGRQADRNDIVIAIDVSESTLVGSGYDLDGDGHFPAGKTSVAALRRLGLGPDDGLARLLSGIDLEDSILMAEVEAAEALIGWVDLETTRVGIVVFSDEAQVMSPITTDREKLEAGLTKIRRRFGGWLGGTNFEAALASSIKLFGAEGRGVPVSKSIVFLSDGQPTLPVPPHVAIRNALGEARAAAEQGIRIYPFALGPPALRGLDVYREMADITGGDLEELSVPAEVVPRLRGIALGGLDSVSITNVTNGSAGIAVRTFPDGAFDGFLKLETGQNRLRVEATLADGKHVAIERGITLLDIDSLTPEQAALAREQLAAIRERIRIRALKLELWVEMQRIRRKRVEIRAIEP